MKRIIISESQCKMLVNHISENNQAKIVGKVARFLDSSYEPAIGTVRKGGEYYDKAMIKNVIDNKMINLKELLDYLKYKFEGLSEDFLKQIIRDWFNGKLEGSDSLSKNVKTAS